jgi:hypothetical protein
VADAKYTVVPETERSHEPIFVSVGFHRGRIAYILRNRSGEEIKRELATPENAAAERPRGFFQSLARIAFGGGR